MASLVEKQIHNFLEETRRVAGVQHVFVCDHQGIVLGARSESDFDSVTLNRASMMVVQMLAALDKRGGKPADIETHFEHGALVVRNMGNALGVIVCTPKVNWSLLHIALNVTVSKFTQDTHLQKALAQLIPFPEVLQVMTMFIDAMLEEFGDRGTGRERFLQAIEPGLGKLKVKYPFLHEVTVVNGRMDLSSLAQPLGAPREIIQAWGELIMEICDRAIDALGESAVVKRYRDAGMKVYRPHKKVFQEMDLESVIPALELPVGF